ncbi:hypothetical protein PHYSODRAFT_377811, partial [Phytophthora sojae]
SAALVAVRDAIALRKFPPELQLPEKKKDFLFSSWHGHPTLAWAPECLRTSRVPKCVVEGCLCEPKVKEYLQRYTHDVDHKTVLYYARYCCTGPHATRTFSTIDDEYLASSPELLLPFPYLLTYQTGVSRELSNLVYDSMLTTRGISGASSSVTRCRQRRYYALLSVAGVEAEKRRQKEANYSPPMLVSLEQYMEANACLDDEALQKIWLTQTEICSRLLEAHMTQCKIKRVIRLDNSQKFCSKLKVFGAQGKKDQSREVRMLLLAQNEIGQIVARGLTHSENHAETAAILNLLIDKVFNGALVVKQDPFHVIQRFTEKVKDHVMRGWLATELSSAIYTADHKIREPEEMATLFSTALGKIPASS